MIKQGGFKQKNDSESLQALIGYSQNTKTLQQLSNPKNRADNVA